MLGLGRLLGVGPGRERVVPAVAHRHRLPALGDGAGAPRHAARLEPVAAVRHVLAHHPRHVHHPVGRARRRCTRSPSRASGPAILGFFALIVAVTVGLIGWRGDRLRSPGRIDSPLSREGAFLANNVLFARVRLRRAARHRVPAARRGGQRRAGLGRRALLQPHDHADRPHAAVPHGRRPGAAVAQGQRRAAAPPPALAGVDRHRLRWCSACCSGSPGFAPLLAFGLGGFAAGSAGAPARAGHPPPGLARPGRPGQRRHDRAPRRGGDRRGVRRQRQQRAPGRVHASSRATPPPSPATPSPTCARTRWSTPTRPSTQALVAHRRHGPVRPGHQPVHAHGIDRRHAVGALDPTATTWPSACSVAPEAPDGPITPAGHGPAAHHVAVDRRRHHGGRHAAGRVPGSPAPGHRAGVGARARAPRRRRRRPAPERRRPEPGDPVEPVRGGDGPDRAHRRRPTPPAAAATSPATWPSPSAIVLVAFIALLATRKTRGPASSPRPRSWARPSRPSQGTTLDGTPYDIERPPRLVGGGELLRPLVHAVRGRAARAGRASPRSTRRPGDVQLVGRRLPGHRGRRPGLLRHQRRRLARDRGRHRRRSPSPSASRRCPRPT